MSFHNLGLCQELLHAIDDQGYTLPTPVQIQAIPFVLAGRDLLAGAQTGTGKTAAFALPILEGLRAHANASTSPARHPIRALVLTPTRELAVQVEESFRVYGKHLPLRSAVVYGGVNMDPQIAELREGREIVVATPGRLLDHVQSKTINLSQVQIFVLDEADRMLDMGFIRDIRRIMEQLPRQRQNLLFSATFSSEIKALADSLLHNPEMIEVARRSAAADTITQKVYLVEQEKKRAALIQIIKNENLQQVLVFMRTKHGANRLATQLVRDGLNASAIHSNKTQGAREQALEDFKSGAVKVLVATDVAARGLDIEELPHVINFEIPHVAEDYVHRIGRTGRAGLQGDAISLVAPEEIKFLKDIERLLKRELPRGELPGIAISTPEHTPERSRAPRERREPARDGAPSTRERSSAFDQRSSASRSAKPFDPIFTQPYQPSTAPIATATAGVPLGRRKPARPMAVLLGGGNKPTS
jgi:ATP-dependent RNA helicase RhlE